jgi:5'-methylthioadenosine phosphorylase
MIGLIGGTGLYDPDFLLDLETVEVETTYGGCEVWIGKIEAEKVVFLPRHGVDHEIPPHKVDYRKNIMALKIAGVERIVSINSVGSLDNGLPPASILIPHDFIDFTKSRDSTFYDNGVVHVDMTKPYCDEIRKHLISCAEKFHERVFREGVYVCTQGPRFESATEIKMLRSFGGDVVGMVGFPEVALAREAELCYASICTIANYGCGLSNTPLTVAEVKDVLTQNMDSMKRTLKCAIKSIPERRLCSCAGYLSEARV